MDVGHGNASSARPEHTFHMRSPPPPPHGPARTVRGQGNKHGAESSSQTAGLCFLSQVFMYRCATKEMTCRVDRTGLFISVVVCVLSQVFMDRCGALRGRGASYFPRRAGADEKTFPRGAPMQHLAPRRHPES